MTITAQINGATLTGQAIAYPLPLVDGANNTTAEAMSLQWLIERDPVQLTVAVGLDRLTQRYALGTLWFATVGGGGPAAGQNDPPGTDECSWPGVGSCFNNMIGRLRWEQVVNASSTTTRPFQGTLPPDLALMTQLTNVSLPGMGFRGTLPSSYSQWTNLEELYLQRNDLTGTLPASYASWGQLRVFYVEKNKLKGSIPTDYSAWTGLQYFAAADNVLTGRLPAAWPRLEQLRVSENALTGPLPASVWTTNALRKLIVYENALTGTIPESLAVFNDMMIDFQLHVNKFNGTLPAAFATWNKGTSSVLKTFYVYSNMMTGSMPLCNNGTAASDDQKAEIVADCEVTCTCCSGECVK
jgi:hypothetical protein